MTSTNSRAIWRRPACKVRPRGHLQPWSPAAIGIACRSKRYGPVSSATGCPSAFRWARPTPRSENDRPHSRNCTYLYQCKKFSAARRPNGRRPKMRYMLQIARLAMAAACLTAAPMVAVAQPYPSRPIHLIVGFPPGGINDIVARIVGQRMSEGLGQAVVVENRSGAGGTIGADWVSKAKPDGYTCLLGSVSNLAMAPSLYGSLPYDPTKDFTPVALVAAAPNIMVVYPDFPVHSVKDLIALAKQKPGTINYASAGIGTSNHLTVELLKVMADIDLVHVPYKGDAPAITAVLANQVPMMFPTLPVALPYIKSGKLRAIAVSSAKRSALLPEVPTVAE